jgi:hypothetical protein
MADLYNLTCCSPVSVKYSKMAYRVQLSELCSSNPDKVHPENLSQSAPSQTGLVQHPDELELKEDGDWEDVLLESNDELELNAKLVLLELNSKQLSLVWVG